MFWVTEGHHYYGEWISGCIDGFGVYIYKDVIDSVRIINNLYAGPFTLGEKNGIGLHLFSDGSLLAGKWNAGFKEDKFIYRD